MFHHVYLALVMQGMLRLGSALLTRSLPLRFHYSSLNLKMSYLAVHVKAQVIPSHETTFYATALQASHSMLPLKGVLRYDILRNNEDPTKFLLVKVFDDVHCLDEHKTTQFYKDWTDKAEPLMQGARITARFNTLFPVERSCWNSQAAVPSSTPLDLSKANTTPSYGESLITAAKEGMLAVVVDIQVSDNSYNYNHKFRKYMPT